MKYLILKTIVLLVALMFIGTAFFVAETHDYNSATSGNRSNIGITMFSQKSGPNNSGYVKYTLDLTNNTLINGNFVNTHNGFVTHEKGEKKTGKKKYVYDYLIKRIVNPYYFLFPITAIAEPITAIATAAPIMA